MCGSTPKIPTMKPFSGGLSTLLQDFRGQMSWGRICAVVALVVAVIGQIKGADVEHLTLWLSVATGNYAASKITEMVCSKRTVETGGSS